MSSKEAKKEEKPKDGKEEKKDEKKVEKPQKPKTVLTELKRALYQLELGLSSNDARAVLKITKGIRRFKKALKPHMLQKVWEVFYPNDKKINFESYPEYNADFQEKFQINKQKLTNICKYQEVEIYLRLHLLIFYMKNKDYQNAYQLSTELLQSAKAINKRHFDNLNSLIYFYYSRTRELQNQLLEIREELYQAYRTSTLRHDEIGQATLLNLLLRNYLHYKHYDAAEHLLSKTEFPASKSNNEYCRYLYYTGKISAVRQDYKKSLDNLKEAIRKSPDNTAMGFKIEAQKLAIVVEMLQGDLPTRDTFAQEKLANHLVPYYNLVKTVHKGSMIDYKGIVAKYATAFMNDQLYTLILRLHQMVIKTGLRKINLSYSRISFDDIAQKLNLQQNMEVEFIIAKAIRDGILNAEINHEKQFITIKEVKDLYTTNEPQLAFQQRIDYCLNLYNKSNRALQYPNSSFKYTEKKEEEDISPEQLLKMLADSDDF